MTPVIRYWIVSWFDREFDVKSFGQNKFLLLEMLNLEFGHSWMKMEVKECTECD